MKLNLSLIVFSILVGVLIFQNCGKIVLSDKVSSQVGALGLSALDVDAENIIKTMLSAGLKDNFEFDETLDLAAETMTCGIKAPSTGTECAFTKEKIKLTTSATTVVAVKSFLNNMGVARDCPTCNDSESYTVKNLKCKRIPNFPRDSKCEFTK